MGAASWVLLPGSLVAGRYRILERLGGGGMGQVFRAEDTVLQQTVALKFLHASTATRAESLIREARQARQVTHANVTRVHDVDQWEGRPFLSMAFVAGEDLANLQRRIGRLPFEKSMEVARQLCQGLQAAHEAGVLHRDLKPANILMDEKGDVSLTDFGVAASIEDADGEAGLAGTPAYMAPELFTGEGPSVASDVYSLGLVLYELFTGRPVFEAESMTELLQMHRRSPEPPSRVVSDIDHDLEDVILACLARDPDQRPPSALAVLARLPGVDLLGEAVARGETPSPELLAAAGRGEHGSSCVRKSILAVLVAVLALIGVFSLESDVKMTAQAHLPEPPEVLRRDAERLLEDIGLAEDMGARSWGFAVNEWFLDALQPKGEPHRWSEVGNEHPAAFEFWYRTAPGTLTPTALRGRVTEFDPGFRVPGMIRVVQDPDGTLRRLQRVPYEHDAAGASLLDESIRDRLLVAAGLDPTGVDEIDSEDWHTIPHRFATARYGWRGSRDSGAPVQIEVAVLGPEIVDVAVVDLKWSVMAERADIPAFVAAALNVFKLLALIGALYLAWSAVRAGRADRVGAFRFALVVFGMQGVATLLTMDHSASPGDEGRLLLNAMARSLLVAAQYWVFYLAVEAHVRRHWPGAIVGWARLLKGRGADPAVGYSVLVGTALGLVGAVTSYTSKIAYELDGTIVPPLMTGERSLEALGGTAERVGAALEIAVFFTGFAMTFFMGMVLCRILFRRPGIALGAWAGVQAFLWLLQGNGYPNVWNVLLVGSLTVLCVVAVVRIGLVVILVAAWVYGLTLSFPMTTETTDWRFGGTLFAVVVIALLLAYGLRSVLRPTTKTVRSGGAS